MTKVRIAHGTHPESRYTCPFSMAEVLRQLRPLTKSERCPLGSEVQPITRHDAEARCEDFATNMCPFAGGE